MTMPEEDNTTVIDNDAEKQQLSTPSTPSLPSYDDPRQWSTLRKILSTAIVCLMTLSLTYASSAYTSSSASLMQHFHSSFTLTVAGVSLFVVGFAVGPLLFGPAAQIFGHRRVYAVTFLLFTAFSFGASESPDIASLLVFRCLSGVFGSSALNNAPASIGDMTTPANANKYMLFYALSAFAGPGLGPLLGAFIEKHAGFRWNLRVQAIFVACMTVLSVVYVKETNHVFLQRQKAAKETSWREQRRLFQTAIGGPFRWLFTDPIVAIVCLYLSLLYTILYLTFVIVPFTFEGIRGFDPISNGLIFISLLIGFLLAAVIFAIAQQRYTLKVLQSLAPGEQPKPEIRLRQALWASFLPPIGLFIFAWTAPFPHVHWVGACFGLAVFTFGMFVIFTSFIPYLVAYGASHAPLLLAAATFTRSLLAAAFPLFSRQMFTAMTVQGTCSMLAGVCLLLTPLPILLTRFSDRLHKRKESNVNA